MFNDKVDELRRRLRELESAVVAFSGGVDSSVLVKIARDELGERMVAVTAVSESIPAGDRETAKTFCADLSIPHVYVQSSEFEDEDFLANPPERCYFCKKNLYSTLAKVADERGLKFVVEGTNASDLAGHRPGYRASRENGRVVTPLIDAGFTKEEVRRLARELSLPTAGKPAAACLSSRIPSGVRLEKDILSRIDMAEDVLRGLGTGQVRVRHHGDIARIEVEEADMPRLLGARKRILEEFERLGWKFVTIDIAGYRTGSLSESKNSKLETRRKYKI